MHSAVFVGCLLLACEATADTLHDAALCQQPAQLRALLSQTKTVDQRDAAGMTPLHIAVKAEKPDCVELLVKAGANVRATNKDGVTPKQLAATIQDTKVRQSIQFMLLAASQEISYGPNPWSLEYAALRGQTDVVAMLLKMGSDPNAIGPTGTTPLENAALKGHSAIVRLLLSKAADVNLSGKSGMLPIHDAALGGDVETIRLLLAHGASGNAKTQENGETPLHLAAAWGKLEAVRALLEAGVQTDLKDAKGRTAAQAASANGQEEIATMLRALKR